jgi:hypothetical protein
MGDALHGNIEKVVILYRLGPLSRVIQGGVHNLTFPLSQIFS